MDPKTHFMLLVGLVIVQICHVPKNIMVLPGQQVVLYLLVDIQLVVQEHKMQDY
jgi:hypothetical protein